MAEPRRRQAREGALLVGPALLGTFAWGVVTGIALVNAGLSVPQALGMVVLVFSGTAQLTALPLMAAGASLPLIWLTALLASLRFVVYSAVVATEFRRVPPALRLVAGYLTTDSGLAAYLAGTPRGTPQAQRSARFVGANLTVYATWQAGSLAGVALAGVLPPSPRLAFVGVLAILALVAPMLRGRAAWAAAAAAAGVAVIGQHWPWKAGMFAAIAAGVLAALLADRTRRSA